MDERWHVVKLVERVESHISNVAQTENENCEKLSDLRGLPGRFFVRGQCS